MDVLPVAYNRERVIWPITGVWFILLASVATFNVPGTVLRVFNAPPGRYVYVGIILSIACLLITRSRLYFRAVMNQPGFYLKDGYVVFDGWKREKISILDFPTTQICSDKAGNWRISTMTGRRPFIVDRTLFHHSLVTSLEKLTGRPITPCA